MEVLGNPCVTSIVKSAVRVSFRPLDVVTVRPVCLIGRSGYGL